MKRIEETFNGVKIKIKYNTPKVLDIVSELEVCLENKEGKQVCYNYSAINSQFGKATFDFSKDRLFYEILEHLCISYENISFEQYCSDMQTLGESRNIDEQKKEYISSVEFSEKIKSVVAKEWIDSIKCYLYLQNYSELWS